MRGLKIDLSHKNVQTMMVYTHVPNRGGQGVRIPLERFLRTASGERGGILGPQRSAYCGEGLLDMIKGDHDQSGCRHTSPKASSSKADQGRS